MSTESYQDFSNALVKIVGRKSSDTYLNQLLYANVIGLMASVVQLAVPLVVDWGRGPNWATGHG